VHIRVGDGIELILPALNGTPEYVALLSSTAQVKPYLGVTSVVRRIFANLSSFEKHTSYANFTEFVKLVEVFKVGFGQSVSRFHLIGIFLRLKLRAECFY
jgi:hypothetical protein